MPLPLAAQDSQDRKHEHHHYKLIDLGTFGGPQSFVDFPQVGYAPVLNNSGTVAGWADTAVPDPHPNFCFLDCYVEHAFLSKGIGKTNLGSLPAPIPTSSQPNWIAESGYAAGKSENGELDPLVLDPSGSPFFPEIRAVLWGEDGIVDLGTLDGGYESVANAVNDHGQVVGLFTNTIPDANSLFGLGYQTRAFIWKGGVMHDLGTLGGTDAQATLINDRGQVVGESYLDSNPSPPLCVNNGFALATGAFLWEKGKMQNLGSTCTVPSDLNDRGQIVGVSSLAGDQNDHAFLWENGTMKDLGNTFGGADSSAIAINRAGHVVGSLEPAGDNPSFMHASLWKNGVQTDLGAFGTDCAFADTINSKDQIAGASYANCNFELLAARGFLYENGELVDLNNLVPPDSTLHVAEPETINDRGEIAGLGVDAGGNSRAFLLIPLIPCDEDHPEVEGCEYDMVDADTAAQGRPALINESSAAASGAKRTPTAMMTRYRSALMRRNQRFGAMARK